MANQLITAEVIAGEALDVLRNNAVMPNLVYKDYSKDFVAGTGGKITIRKPTKFEAKDFNGTIEVQDAQENSTDVTMDVHKDVSFSVTSKELTQNITDFSAQFLTPAMQAFLDVVDSALISAAVAGTTQTATATKVGQGEIVTARKNLVAGKAPTTDRYFVFGPETEADLLNTDLFVHADQAGDTSGLREASLGRKFGLDFFTDQNCTDAKGSSESGIVFHKNAIALVSRQLELPKGAANASVASYDGFNIRVVYGYDMVHKTDTVSLDMIYGVKVLYPELISVIKRTVKAA